MTQMENYLNKTEGFQWMLPGQYTDVEKRALEQLNERFETIRNADLDIDDLVSGRLPDDHPRKGPVLKVDREMMLFNAEKYDPHFTPYFDEAYAKSLGYRGLLAYPTIGCHDDTFTIGYPMNARDLLLVTGLDSVNTFHAPVVEGDTLFFVHDDHYFYDNTIPTGSYFRTINLTHKGSVYNQRGELVYTLKWSYGESGKRFEDQENKPEIKGPPMMEVNRKPNHVYTDEDYEFIKSIWAKEHRQGSEVLYWEDVEVGSCPAPTLDGPMIQGAMADREKPLGCGSGGYPALREEILNPEIKKTLLRDEKSGVYYKEGQNQGRFGFSGINLVTRDYAVHHINNWIGEHGKLCSISWSARHWDESYGPVLPRHPEGPTFLQDVPVIPQNRACGFPLFHDIYYVQSYVKDKYLKNNRYLVDLIWWNTSITGDITIEGCATVELPHRG